MATCANGHESETGEWCDVCGGPVAPPPAGPGSPEDGASPQDHGAPLPATPSGGLAGAQGAPLPTGPAGGMGGAWDAFVAGAATAALLPFLQAMATQAGQQAFDAARERITALFFRRQDHPDLTVIAQHGRLRVEEVDGELSFEVPPGLPDSALEALARTDLELLARPDPDGRPVLVYWDEDSRQWLRHPPL